MWTVDGELERALNSLNLPESELRRCGEEEAKIVINKAMEIFVEGNPRVWWLSLKTPFKAFSYDEADGFKHLEEHIPDNENRCWFIAENEEAMQPVFDATIDSIVKLIGECFYFEYYLVSKNFTWLIIDNDHNEIIVTRKG